MPVPSTAIKPLEEAVGHAVDAANLQEEQLSPDAVVSFVGQHLMRFGTMAASEEPAVVRKLRADVSQASADDVLDALSRGERQIVQLRQRMQSALKEVARPWLAELAKFLGSDMAAEVAPVRRAQAVAQAVDSAFTAFREPMMALLHDDALGLKAAVGEEAMHEIKVATRITATAAAKVESRVEWTPPAMQDDVKAALAKMAEAQKAAEGQLREGKGAGPKLDALGELLDKEWMPALAARLEKLATDEGIDELHATLPAVARDLLPKFERIYRATGDGIVRQQGGYADFVQLVERAFGELNARPKPAQPTKSVRELTTLSVKAQPLFNELMAAVGAAGNAGVDGQGGQVPPGGVAWQPAPLKKAQRIVEKLSFDPAQRERVLARPCRAEALDASGMLDTVRGMFVCNSMEHALAVLRLLVARFDHESGSDKGQARLERSKDRFAQPSGGGWMDCLINIGVHLGGDAWLVGEVQIVHRQLLVVRAELGAHHGYGIYRAALEMLEATGNLALATGDERALREWALRAMLATCRDAEGQSLERHVTAALLDVQVWALSRAQGARPYPRLLELDLGGHAIASIECAAGSDAATLWGGVQAVHGAVDPRRTEAVLQASKLATGLTSRVSSHVLKGHTGIVMSAAVSPDGVHVVTASDDKTARVWRLADGELVRELKGHTGAVSSAAVSADGVHVVTASHDNTARVWRLVA